MSMTQIREHILKFAHGSAALIVLGIAGAVLGGILMLIHNMWVNIHPVVATLFCIVTLLPLSYYIGVSIASISTSPSNTSIPVPTSDDKGQEVLDKLVASLVHLNEVYADASEYSLEELVQQTEETLECFNTYAVHRIDTDSTFLEKLSEEE